MTVGLAGQLYVVANMVIALGYLCVPWLVLPYLDLRRRTRVAGAVFFIGCTGSHLDMVYDVLVGHDQHPPVGWTAVGWHVLQAIGTWAFIILFRVELISAARAVQAVQAGDGGDETHDLSETLAGLRATHLEPPPTDGKPDPMDEAVGRLPGKGEWVKAAPAVFMVCGTLIIVAILAVFGTLTMTGTPTDTFFRLVNLFLNALGTIATLAVLSVGIIHARRTLENRHIAMKGQAEAHRAADAATSAAKGVNGELTRRVVEAAREAAREAVAETRRDVRREDAADEARGE